jgi:hypothetical protein
MKSSEQVTRNALICVNIKSEPLQGKNMPPEKEKQFKLILENDHLSNSDTIQVRVYDLHDQKWIVYFPVTE